MKICLINNLYKPYDRGGAERVVETQINELTVAGHDVFLISTKPHGNKAPIATELKIYHLDSSYHKLNSISIITKFFWHIFNIFNYIKYEKVKKILGEEKPDLVITHNLMGLGFLLPRAIKELGIEHHHFLHDIQLLHPSGLMFYGQERKIDSLFARTYQAILKSLIASPQKIISPSQWLIQEHSKRNFFPKSKIEISPLRVKINKPNLKTTEKEKQKTFVFFGQVEKHKGIFLLIGAFKKLNNDNKLIIIGNGKGLKKAKKISRGYNIEFHDKQAGMKLFTTIASGHYVVVPSLCYENSPATIYEAQELDMPVIASNLGGIPEIIKENDVLFAAGNEKDLIEKMKNI